jgi:O-antigen/teichoic acid export membrane protein
MNRVLVRAARRVNGPVGQAAVNGMGIQLALLVSGVLSARILGPRDRGQQVLLTTIPSVFAFLGALGLPQAVTFFTARDERQGRRLVKDLRPWLCGLMTAVLVAQTIVLIVSVSAAAVNLALASGSLAICFVVQFVVAYLQGIQQFGRSFIVQASGPTAFAAELIALYMFDRKASVTEVLFAWLLALMTSAIFGLAYCLGTGRPSSQAVNDDDQRVVELRRAVSFGLSGLLGVSSPLETFRVDQLVVGLALSQRDLGLYAAALSFANGPKLLGQAVGAVAAPKLAREASDRPGHLRRYVIIGLVLSFGSAAALELLMSGLVLTLYGEPFRPALSLARLLVLAGAFMAMRRLLSDCARGMGKPGLGSVAEIGSWAILAPCFILLVPLLGREGVGLAVLASAATSASILMLTVFRLEAKPAV